MFSTVQLDQISDQIVSMSLPEVVYGHNRLYFVNKSRDFLYEINPIESLKLISFERVNKFFVGNSDDLVAKIDQMTISEQQESCLNLVDVVPEQLKIKQSEHWKDRDFSKVKDFKNVEVISDWTFSTPYKGNVFYLHNHVERIKNETNLKIDLPEGLNKDEADI